MKKILLLALVLLGMTACSKPVDEAINIAVEVCENIKSADFDILDLADADLIQQYKDLREYDKKFFKRTVQEKMDCKVTDVEAGSNEGSFRVNFANANSLNVALDLASDDYKVKYEYRGTSNLFL
ncbi:hypothetical protein TUM4261_01290 [Shewanella sp. c952]|uniref:hypothetical protein n=1 Tax=Shewanella sp. c952 TaxID=2815913 RepID=UPI001BC78925|nr:hypothetical protein [Shewanella sp. c952]GIU03515.1 hypothetical protein TUM4261_01290 [Shewanella sp. c952]